jgi:uncharacterized protein with HEPN domain
VSQPPLRPDRLALLELDALLGHILRLRDAGDRARFDADDDYRWAIHRIWIAIGNEALAYLDAAGLDRRTQPWASLYQQRNILAHRRLPDIDEDQVWRVTAMRAESFRTAVRADLR